MKDPVRKLKTLALCALFSLTALLSGCTRGNPEEIRYALDKIGERYGIALELVSVIHDYERGCDVYAKTDALPGKNIHVYLYPGGTEKPMSDYIYLKYGAEAQEIITAAAQSVTPDSKVVIFDNTYNHFETTGYDADEEKQLASYLQNNAFIISVFTAESEPEEQRQERYDRTADALSEAGVNASLLLYFMESAEAFDKIRTFDYIPEEHSKPFLFKIEGTDHVVGSSITKIQFYIDSGYDSRRLN